MITAITLLNVEHDHINEVAKILADMDGVSEVYSVSGRYDLVAILKAQTHDEVADIATEHMLMVKGIQKTETMVAFRVCSPYAMDHMFSIGMVEPK